MRTTFMGDRMKKWRRKKQITQVAMGKLLGVSQSQISKYESCEDEPSYGTIKMIAQFLEVSVPFLVGESHNPYSNGPRAMEVNEALTTVISPTRNAVLSAGETRIQRIPLLEKIGPGELIPAEHRIVGWVDTGLEADFALKVNGDEMHPLVPRNALVYVNRSLPPKNGFLAVVMTSFEDAVICRVFFDPSGVILQWENPHFPPRFFSTTQMEKECKIIGIIVEYQVFPLDVQGTHLPTNVFHE
ncbi:MAG TPA: XRE family transcriptional regulator [Thermotogota bacterium]|nr:XRE family transcriptional regulator [Thermotogota bacterium]